MSRPALIVLSLSLALAAISALAAPAPWYVWASTTSAQRICAQISPGPAWRKVDGPYRNAACRAAPYPSR